MSTLPEEEKPVPHDPLLDGLCDHGLHIEDCELGCKKAYDMIPGECPCTPGQRNSTCEIHGAHVDDGVFV